MQRTCSLTTARKLFPRFRLGPISRASDAAWLTPQALDVSGDGNLSFQEFAQACRTQGFSGDVKKLWKELDDDDSGVRS